jgi:hypothetical protein
MPTDLLAGFSSGRGFSPPGAKTMKRVSNTSAFIATRFVIKDKPGSQRRA